MPQTPQELLDRVAGLRDRISAVGQRPDAVTVVAVTKGFGVDVVSTAKEAGLVDLGENYANELAVKGRKGDGIRWHFLGRVQRTNIARISDLVELWHGVDRPAAVQYLAGRCPGAAILIQVDSTRSPKRGGCTPDQVGDLLVQSRTSGLDVRGLMTVGPEGDPVGTRQAFREVVRLADEFRLPERSMGMTDDFEIAIEEGATIVRIGRALFGPRTASPH